MTFEEVIEIFFPYLHSIRRLKTYITIDLTFPPTWDCPNDLVEKLQVTQNDADGKLITTFVTEPKTMSFTLNGIQNLIYHNLEREEKEKLFRTKVSELKKLFGSTTLEQLKHLEFNVYDETDEEHEPQLYGGDDEEIHKADGERT
jgi:hypothetical protein